MTKAYQALTDRVAELERVAEEQRKHIGQLLAREKQMGLGLPSSYYGKLDEALSGGAGEYADMSVYKLNSAGNDWEDTNKDLRVFASPLLETGDRMEQDTWLEAQFNLKDRRHYVKPPGGIWRPFELKESMKPTDTSKTAYLLEWDSELETWDTAMEGSSEDEIEFTVYNSMHGWRGYGADDTETGESGFYGWARFMPQIGGYEIKWMQPWIEKFKALVNMGSGLQSADTWIIIDNIQIMTAGSPAVTVLKPDLSGPLTQIDNTTFGWNGCNNAELIAVWDEAGGAFLPSQLECC